jgi:hypothetical protein
MYVAASRARNLIVVTNFPNFVNTEDQSISQLENRALEELQTKDTDFIAQRDLEINGSKSIMGSEYNRSVRPAVTVQAEERVETPLDQEEEIEEEDEDEETETEEQEQPDTVEEEELDSEEEEEFDTSLTPEVVSATGIEDNVEDTEVSQPYEAGEAPKKDLTEMWDKIKEGAVTSFNKMKDSVVELLFPTAQTIKYKIADGEFTVKIPDTYENKNIATGDIVTVIPFQQSPNSNSPRKFGYAVVTPAIDQDGKVIENSYRTISVLSDYEIDKLREKPETSDLYDAINQNERRDKGFVSILYSDVSDENGFTTSSNKVINEIEKGKVVHAQTVKYFYSTSYKDMNRATMDEIITEFINNFYDNHINSFPESQRQAERDKIRRFYQNSENAQIIIPTRKDVEGTKPLLNIPPELRSYVRAGRPYLAFKPFHRRSSMQFIGLSRKFLNTNLHNETVAPIRDFVNTAKVVKRMLESKGVTNKMGISRSLSTMLSRIANDFVKDPNKSTYDITFNTTQGGRKTSRDLSFSNTEAERIYNLYAMYSEPNTQMIKAETEKEIQNLTNVRRARNYIFEDGDVIYGTIDSYDPNTKTFEVKDIRSGEIVVKSGVIHHRAKSYVGIAQQALDDIVNSNGHIAEKFTSKPGRIGFVTDRDVAGTMTFHKGYKFMNILGSKAAPIIPKSYNPDGTVAEYYEDVIEILEDLFNFATRGEMQGKTKQYVDDNGQVQDIEVKFRVPVPLNSRDDAGNLEYDYTNTSQNTSRDTTIPNSRFFESNFESMLPTRVFVEFGEVEEEQPTAEGQATQDERFIEQQAEEQVQAESILEEQRIKRTRQEEQINELEEKRRTELSKVQDISLDDLLVEGKSITYQGQVVRVTAIDPNNFILANTAGDNVFALIPRGSRFTQQIRENLDFLRYQNGQVEIDRRRNEINEKYNKEIEKIRSSSGIEEIKGLTKQEIQTLPFIELARRFTPQEVDQLDQYAKNNGWRDFQHFWGDLVSSHPEEQEVFRDYIIECLL